MPRGDGMGPAGMGPLTGRGAGFCNGFNAGFGGPGCVNRGGGFGRGGGAGRGFQGRPGYGRGLGLAGNVDSQTEQALLQNQASTLKAHLDTVQQRLNNLKKGE